MTESIDEQRDEITPEERAAAAHRADQLIELAHRFTYHAPKDGQVERYQQVRAAGLEFAALIVLLSPVSREQSIAFTRLEEVVMYTNAAIAREVELEVVEGPVEVGADDVTDPGGKLNSADISQARQRAEMCESVELTRGRYLELLDLAEIGLMVPSGNIPDPGGKS